MPFEENKLADLLAEKEKKKSSRPFNLLSAPDMGGDFNSRGMSFGRDGNVLDIGRYSTDQGRNYYAYGGMTPYNIDQLQIGGAVGAYGPRLDQLNALAGLLLNYKMRDGQARGLISPSINGSGPSVFLGYEKKF